jgi:hypothetical protein
MEAMLHAEAVYPMKGEPLIRDRLQAGTPLLRFEDFHPGWKQVQTVFEQILAWAALDPEGPPDNPEILRGIAFESFYIKEAAEDWYRGRSLRKVSGAQQIDPDLLTSLVGASLKPFLRAYSRWLMPEVDQERWRRRVCPVCGGKPDFNCLREGGTRWLLCSRCDGEWLFPRIECPYCGTRNQGSLGYFAVEDLSASYRLHVCDECRTYIKGIDLRNAGEDVLLPLARLMTSNLDRQGREKGYVPGWVPRENGEEHGGFLLKGGEAG